MTGGRIKRIQPYVGNEPFMMTYGDGVSNINISNLLDFHRKHGKIGTLTAVQPEGRFGVLDLNGNRVNNFREKNKEDMGLINAGYMVFQPEIFDYLIDDNTVFENEPLEKLAAQGELLAYRHYGFWQCMDTQRDKKKLEGLWESGNALWKVWNH
jgi:glucose-1-phosphate cytidylyltransferase